MAGSGIKDYLNYEIRQPESNDIVSRLYGYNQSCIPRPTSRAVPGPTDCERQIPTKKHHHMSRNEQIEFTHDEKISKRNQIGVEDDYLYFDSFDKDATSDPENGLFIYDIQKLNNSFPLQSIIVIEVGNILIPKIEVDESYQPNFFINRKILMEIENIASTQHIRGGTKLKTFHFEFIIKNMFTDFIEIEPQNERYIFTIPIRSIQMLKIRFKSLTQNAKFKQDTFNAAALPTIPGPGGNQRIQTNKPHGLSGTGIAVYVSDFLSTNPVLNQILNDPTGHLVDVVDANTLQFTNTPNSAMIGNAVDIAGMPPKCIIQIATRRIAFPLRFRGIRTELTNFISPS